MVIVTKIFNLKEHLEYVTEKVPLYIIGLAKDEPANEILFSKFGGVLEKAKIILPEIIESKISIKSQNSEGSRTHFDVTATVTTSKNQLIYTSSGWDILKISDELCRKLEGEFSKHDDKRQRKSIRKKEH